MSCSPELNCSGRGYCVVDSFFNHSGGPCVCTEGYLGLDCDLTVQAVWGDYWPIFGVLIVVIWILLIVVSAEILNHFREGTINRCLISKILSSFFLISRLIWCGTFIWYHFDEDFEFHPFNQIVFSVGTLMGYLVLVCWFMVLYDVKSQLSTQSTQFLFRKTLSMIILGVTGTLFGVLVLLRYLLPYYEVTEFTGPLLIVYYSFRFVFSFSLMLPIFFFTAQIAGLISRRRKKVRWNANENCPIQTIGNQELFLLQQKNRYSFIASLFGFVTAYCAGIVAIFNSVPNAKTVDGYIIILLVNAVVARLAEFGFVVFTSISMSTKTGPFFRLLQDNGSTDEPVYPLEDSEKHLLNDIHHINSFWEAIDALSISSSED